MILGVILAGGRSARFGSDKALAKYQGRSLLDHAIAGLQQWCDEVVVAGRDTSPVPVLADWPRTGLGPLGGIAAGLRHAVARKCTSILTCGVDCVDLPDDLLSALTPPPAYLESQPVIGRWPDWSLATLTEMLGRDDNRSVRAFAKAIGARPARLVHEPPNINTMDDLAAIGRA